MAEGAKRTYVASDDDSDDERTYEDHVYTQCTEVLMRCGVGASSKDKDSSKEPFETTPYVMEQVAMKREELREQMRQLSHEEDIERAHEQGHLTTDELMKMDHSIDNSDVEKEVFGDFPEPRGITRISIGRGRGITKCGKYGDAEMKVRAEAQAKSLTCEEDQRNAGFQDLGNGQYKQSCQEMKSTGSSTSSSSFGSEDGLFHDSFRKPRGRGRTSRPSVFDSEIDSLFRKKSNPKQMNLGE